MTSIHAPIPTNLKRSVKEAKNRGEDPTPTRDGQGATAQRARSQQRSQTDNTTKPTRTPTTPETTRHRQPSPRPQHPPNPTANNSNSDSDSENDDPASSGKENDPSLSPTPVRQLPPTPRRSALGKRPLSVLTTSYPEDPDVDMMLVDSESEPEPIPDSRSTSEQNISANNRAQSPVRKSPKLTLSKGGSASLRLRDELQIYEDVPDRTVNDFTCRFSGVGKENCDAGGGKDTAMVDSAGVNVPVTGTGQPAAMSAPLTPSSLSEDPSSSKVSKKVAGRVSKAAPKKPKPKPRIGIRRL